MPISSGEKTRRFTGNKLTSSGTGNSILLDTSPSPFPNEVDGSYTIPPGRKGDEGYSEVSDDIEYHYQDEIPVDFIAVDQGDSEKEFIIVDIKSKKSLESKIEDFTEEIVRSNELFDEIDRDPFVEEVKKLFDRLGDSAKEELTDQELKTRIKKLAAVEVSSGLLNDLMEEEIEELNESVQDVSLFQGLEDVPMDRQGSIEKYVDRLLNKRKESGSRQYLSLSWAGGLKEYRDEFTAVELQEKSLEWWVE